MNFSAAFLLLALQVPGWTVSPPNATVGDTVRMTRRIEAPPDVHYEVPPLPEDENYIPLSEPVVAYSEGVLVVQYRLALFDTGNVPIEIPDISLTYADGRVETFRSDTAWVRVRAVIPAEESTPQPRGSLGPITRIQRSLAPAIVINASVLVFLIALAMWRRRRSERPKWTAPEARAAEIPLQQWIMAGESKAAISVVYDRLRDAIENAEPAAGRQLSTLECLSVIETRQPDWPIRELGEVMKSLDRAQYAPAIPSDVALMVDQVDDIIASIGEHSDVETDR